MLQNYLKIALRNLRKNRTYTTLNVMGLGLSVGCCILICMLLRHHLTFEHFQSKRERIVQIVSEIQLETKFQTPGAPNPTAAALQQEISGIEKSAMYSSRDEVLISIPRASGISDKYKESDLFTFVQPAIFDIFDYKILRGDLQAMQEPNTALLTEKMANKYFKGEDPIGKTFRMDNLTDLRVVGILRDLPKNTDYPHQILASWSTQKTMPNARFLESWDGVSSSTLCFVLLQSGHSIEALSASMPDFSARHRNSDGVVVFSYFPKPLLGLHFDRDFGSGVNKNFLWALALIGLFLLITACVNFINMATAQALSRVREVGVRKALGSTRRQLFWQFMFETNIIVVAGLVIGVTLSALALPYLNRWTKTELAFDTSTLQLLVPFTLFLGVLLTFLAGFYPGILQARFQTVESLKGSVDARQAGGFSLRRILVASQFAISQMLIIGAAVVVAQIQFAQQADWGFRPGAILTMEVPEETNKANLKQQLSAITGVKNVSLCYQPPAANSNNQTGVRYDNRPESEKWLINTKPADANYIETFGLQLVAGRNIQPSDTVREFVVNETFVKKLGLASPDAVINKIISVDNSKAPIVGVVRDFHNWGFEQPIAAIAISSNLSRFETCAVELEPGYPGEVLSKIQEVWENNYPNHFFESKFMDAKLAEFMEDEKLIMRLIGTFSGIAIFVGCLGLYGLSAFMVARKRKEIGIRKTLGESVSGVLWLFSKEYIRLIIIAFVVAAPVAWWAMNGWLKEYEYRVSIGAGVFVLSLLVTFLVTIVTVGFQAVKAALANPAKSLRSE